MGRTILAMMLAASALGCSRTGVPKENYFDGKPVEHWLDTIKSSDAKSRKKAADVLGNVGPVDPRAVPALIEAVKDRDARVRDAAVLGLSKIGPPASAGAAALEEATKDNDPTVRSHTATALERVRGG